MPKFPEIGWNDVPPPTENFHEPADNNHAPVGAVFPDEPTEDDV